MGTSQKWAVVAVDLEAGWDDGVLHISGPSFEERNTIHALQPAGSHC
jgi:hypothetical protein